jgi:hypothetical protein
LEIATCISKLLYEHECVVIPGLGGFIVNDRPATINRITHEFSPPFRKIMFNVHLSANDGLLINHIASIDGLSYLEAKKRVLDFSKHCQEELKIGNSIDLKAIGRLFKNKEGYISFEQDTSVNHNADAFGLGSFYSPPIERPTDEQRIKSIVEPILTSKAKPKDKKPKADRFANTKRRRRAGAIILSLFIVLASIGGGYALKKDATLYFKSYAMLIPSFGIEDKVVESENTLLEVHKEIPSTSLNEDINSSESETNELLGGTEKENKEAIDNESVNADLPKNEDLKPEVSAIPEKDTRLSEIKPTPKPYLIITGSFSKVSNAKNLVSKLKKAGVNALIADTTKNGMFRVAYASYETIEQAKKELFAIRNNAYPDAWILKKINR